MQEKEEEQYFGDLFAKTISEAVDDVEKEDTPPKEIAEGTDEDLPKEKEYKDNKYRSFFETYTEGPKKELTLAEAVRIAVTPRVFFSKRLAPPFTVCNARVFCGGDYLLKSDIVIPEAAERLHRVAELFGVTLEITYESSGEALWSSDTPTLWRGGNPYGDAPVPIASIMEMMTEIADRQKEQWHKDHMENVFTQDPKKIKKASTGTKVTYTVSIAGKKKKAAKKVTKKVAKKKVIKKKKGRK